MPTKLEWTKAIVDGMPLIVVKDSAQPEGVRIPSDEEAERAIRLLNEEGNTVIRLLCHNPACSDKGGWIERTRAQAEKLVFHCGVCGQKMER